MIFSTSIIGILSYTLKKINTKNSMPTVKYGSLQNMNGSVDSEKYLEILQEKFTLSERKLKLGCHSTSNRTEIPNRC